jgi:hypothetical protein
MLAGVIGYLVARPALIGLMLVTLLAGVERVQVVVAQHGEHTAQQALQAAQNAAAARSAAGAVISAQARTADAAARVLVQTRTVTLIQKVPTYVPAKADADCTVPAGFVGLWNAGAAGSEVPGPAGGPVEAPSGVHLSAVLAADLANFGIAYDWRAEALTWRKWYIDQKAAWGAR